MSILSQAVEGALPELRAYAESLMTDTCKITRPDPDAEPGEMDPETGQYPDRERITVYEGKCRVQDNRAQIGSTAESSADLALVTQNNELQLPITGSESVAVGDVAEMLTCAHDPSLVGRHLTVESLHHKSHATSRRLRVKEGTGS